MASKRFVGEMDWGKPQENGQPTIVFCNQSYNIPEKQFQNDYEIWSDNGKMYKPVNQKAINKLDLMVKDIGSKYSHCSNGWNFKPKSLKYGILAHSEHLLFVK